MSTFHRAFLLASLAAASLALTGCQHDDPAGEWTRSDRFDGGVYAGEQTRSDLDAGAASMGAGGAPGDRTGADSATDAGRAADADNRARLGQETGVNTGAGGGRDAGPGDARRGGGGAADGPGGTSR